jgi:hypothetical protein
MGRLKGQSLSVAAEKSTDDTVSQQCGPLTCLNDVQPPPTHLSSLAVEALLWFPSPLKALAGIRTYFVQWTHYSNLVG